MNTSAPLFTENRFEQEIKKQEAELYSRLYPLAAEDFVAHPDMKVFSTSVITCFESMQQQLITLMRVLSNHQHVVPAHTHTMPPHTHADPVSGMTGPNVGGYSTNPIVVTTQSPVQGGSITWNMITTKDFINTTGSIINLEGNKITVGPSKTGPMIVGKRRLKDDPALLTLPVLPIIKGLATL